MSRKAFAFAVAIALHVGFAWVLFASKPIAPESAARPEPAAHESLRAADRAPRSDAAPRARSAARPRPPPTRYEPGEAGARFTTEAEQRAYERGIEYELLRREALHRFYARAFGDEVAALMQLPIAQAWPALESRALAGDNRAAEALQALGDNCAFDRGERFRGMRDGVSAGLAATDAAFVNGALDTELIGLETEATACRAAGLGRDRLIALAQRRLESLGRSESPPVGDDFHAWLEYYTRAFPSIEHWPAVYEPGPEARRWIEQMELGLGSTDWRELLREGSDDPALAGRVAYCAMTKCGELPPEAWDEATPFIQRAAEHGLPQAILGVIERGTRGDALPEAHAWAEFGMWVIESGCFPLPQMLEYAHLARERAAIAARLTAAQYADARRRFAALIQAHGNAALAAHGCAP